MSDEKYTPIILLASERSGTNLLRAIMSSHEAIASPPPSGMVPVLARSSFRYTSPLKSQHVDQLLADAITLTRAHLHPWDIEITPTEILGKASQISFWSIFRAMNEIYAKDKGASCWFSKEPDLFQFIYEIGLHMPEAKFVYMVRDSRDVAASMLKGGVHAFHVYNAAHRWAEAQRYCLTALSDPLLKDRMFMLKYENLIADPAGTTQQLMAFIGLPFMESQLEYYRNSEIISHSEKSEFWVNTAKPVDAANSGTYKQRLSKKEVEIIESVAWQEMGALNYSLETDRRICFSTANKVIFKLNGLLRKRVMQMMSRSAMQKQESRRKKTQEIANRIFTE